MREKIRQDHIDSIYRSLGHLSETTYKVRQENKKLKERLESLEYLLGVVYDNRDEYPDHETIAGRTMDRIDKLINKKTK